MVPLCSFLILPRIFTNLKTVEALDRDRIEPQKCHLGRRAISGGSFEAAPSAHNHPAGAASWLTRCCSWGSIHSHVIEYDGMYEL